MDLELKINKLLGSRNTDDIILGMNFLKQKSLCEIEEFFRKHLNYNPYLTSFKGILVGFYGKFNDNGDRILMCFQKEDKFIFRDGNCFGICQFDCFYLSLQHILWI